MTVEALPVGWRSVVACDLCGGKAFAGYMARQVDGRQLDCCCNCGLVFLNPQPDASELASWYDERYFTTDDPCGLGSEYLALAETGAFHGTEAFRQLARRRKLRGLRILEIGCGAGAFLQQCANAGAAVSGLEISAFAAERLRSMFGFDVQTGTLRSNSFDDQSFDAVAFADVLEHVLSPAEFLRDLKRLLKPDGFVYGLLPNLDCVAYYGASWGGFRHHAEHLYYLGRKQIELYLDQSGFSPKSIWTFGEPWEPSAGQPSRSVKPGGSALQQIRRTVRQIPGALAMVRACRSALSGLRRETRARRARYRHGLGHDLLFLAELK